MTSPLEAMAKAMRDSESSLIHLSLDQYHKGLARAALLALAEADRSKEEINIGLKDDGYGECFERDFELLLRSIAEGER